MLMCDVWSTTRALLLLACVLLPFKLKRDRVYVLASSLGIKSCINNTLRPSPVESENYSGSK